MQEEIIQQYLSRPSLDAISVRGTNIQPSSLMVWYQKYKQKYSIPLECVPNLLINPYRKRWDRKTAFTDGKSATNKESMTVEEQNLDKLKEILFSDSPIVYTPSDGLHSHEKLEKEYKGLREMFNRSHNLVDNQATKSPRVSIPRTTKPRHMEGLVVFKPEIQRKKVLKKQATVEQHPDDVVADIPKPTKKLIRRPKMTYLKPDFGISLEERNAKLLHVTETRVKIEKPKKPTRKEEGHRNHRPRSSARSGRQSRSQSRLSSDLSIVLTPPPPMTEAEVPGWTIEHVDLERYSESPGRRGSSPYLEVPNHLDLYPQCRSYSRSTADSAYESMAGTM